MSDTAVMPIHPAAELLPMLGDAELHELAEDIAEHGLREPVWLWRDDDGTEYLLDGRNRVAACEMAGVEVASRWYDGDDPITFVVSLNIQRRHLTAGQRAMLALDLVPLYEEQGRKEKARAAAEENRRRAADRATESEKIAPPIDFQEESDCPDGADLHHPDEPEKPKRDNNKRSTHKAASATKGSGRAVGQAKRVTDQAPDLAEKVRNGEMAIDRADRIIRDREAEQRRVDQAKAEAAQAGDVAAVDIRQGDFRDVLADLTGVDAVITDPGLRCDKFVFITPMPNRQLDNRRHEMSGAAGHNVIGVRRT